MQNPSTYLNRPRLPGRIHICPKYLLRTRVRPERGNVRLCDAALHPGRHPSCTARRLNRLRTPSWRQKWSPASQVRPDRRPEVLHRVKSVKPAGGSFGGNARGFISSTLRVRLSPRSRLMLSAILAGWAASLSLCVIFVVVILVAVMILVY